MQNLPASANENRKAIAAWVSAMESAVIRHKTPRGFICPDCYMPTKLCDCLQHPDFDRLFGRKRRG